MNISGSLLALAILLGISCDSRAASPPQAVCTPSFVEVSSAEPIRAEVGSWRVFFRVALVGCSEKLQELTTSDLSAIREEFRQPSDWSNLLLINDARTLEFRTRAVQKAGEILGRPIVTDILFYDIAVLDHNVQ